MLTSVVKKSKMQLAGMSVLENRRENLKLIVVLVLESKLSVESYHQIE